MFIRRWSQRTPGTGRLVALLCAFVPLAVYLAWAAFAAPDESLPHPVVAEFRLVLRDGKPVPTVKCRNIGQGGRMLLGADGRWWMREMDCRTMRWPCTQRGTYRWYGDTLRVWRDAARWGEFPTHVLVQRGDTIDVPRERRGRKYVSRYVRVRTAGPAIRRRTRSSAPRVLPLSARKEREGPSARGTAQLPPEKHRAARRVRCLPDALRRASGAG